MNEQREVAQLLVQWNGPEEKFDQLVTNLPEKVINSFESAEELDAFLVKERVKIGLQPSHIPGDETQRAILNVRRRILNRISARRSRKRKAEEKKELVQENSRLRKRVRELENKIENLEHNWVGCCALCIWQEMEFMD
jgi:flagellar biosynthesis/type III secretory pathway chaperone